MELTVFFGVLTGVWTEDFLEDFGVLTVPLNLVFFSGVKFSSSSSSSLLEEDKLSELDEDSSSSFNSSAFNMLWETSEEF